MPGDSVAAMRGGVVSRLTMTELEVVSPASFVAVHTTSSPAVSAENETGSHPERTSTRESGSETFHSTVTDPLFHPFAFGGGVTIAATTGGVASKSSVSLDTFPTTLPFASLTGTLIGDDGRTMSIDDETWWRFPTCISMWTTHVQAPADGVGTAKDMKYAPVSSVVALNVGPGAQ